MVGFRSGARNAVAAIACLGLASCIWELPSAPPKTVTSAPKPFVTSTISMPIAVDVEAFRSRLVADLQSKPLAKGRSPELGVRLLAQEKSVIEEPRKVIDVPYRAAGCEIRKVEKQITERVKIGTEAFGCWLNPTKWGKCHRDVFNNVLKTVIEDVKFCWDEQKEVFHMVTALVDKFTPKVFDTTAFINYQVDVRSASVEMVGTTIKAAINLNVPISADIKQNLLVGNVTAKGALSCSSDISAGAEISVKFVETGEGIGLSAEVRSVDLDVKKLCIPGAVEIVKAWSFSSVEAMAISAAFKSAVQNAMLDAVKKAVADGTGSLSISGELSKQASEVHGKHDLGQDIWLFIAPKSVSVSQLSGRVDNGRQVIAANASVSADIAVSYGADVPLPRNQVAVSIGSSGDRFHLVPRGVVPLDKIAILVRDTVVTSAGQALKKEGFEIGEVEVYQSGALIVTALAIKSTNWWRPSGRIYMSGRPEYVDAAGTLRLIDFDFTVDTRNWLVKNAITAAYPIAKDLIAPKMVFPVNAELSRATKALREFKKPLGSGSLKAVISVRTELPRLRSVWITDGELRFDVQIDGQGTITPPS